MPERDLLNDIRMAASAHGARLFRNNSGVGWVGQVISHHGGILMLNAPRPLHAGLCVGSSDLIGWTPVTITPEMVGRTIAVFTAVEGKSTTRQYPTADQYRFIDAVRAAGGIATVARSVGDAMGAIKSPGRTGEGVAGAVSRAETVNTSATGEG